MQELVLDLRLRSFCHDFGISLTNVVMLGPDLEDFHHAMERINSEDSRGDRVILVLNEGVIRMVVLAQARAAQYHLHLSEKTLVDRMVNDTLPLFAQQMKETLVIRERRWNQDQGRQRMALAGLVTLMVFLSGFVVRTWVDWDRLGLADRCALHASVQGGHTICDLTASASP